MSWFKFNKYSEAYIPPRTLVVEVEKPNPAREFDKETSHAVARLQHDIGFKALCDKLRLQRSLLISKLANEKQPDLRAVDQIQAAIYWSSWLEKQVNFESGKQPKDIPRSMFDAEEAEFNRMFAALEVVGAKRG